MATIIVPVQEPANIAVFTANTGLVASHSRSKIHLAICSIGGDCGGSGGLGRENEREDDKLHVWSICNRYDKKRRFKRKCVM